MLSAWKAPAPYRNRQQGPHVESVEESPHQPERAARALSLTVEVKDSGLDRHQGLASESAPTVDIAAHAEGSGVKDLGESVGLDHPGAYDDPHVAIRISSLPPSGAKLELLQRMAEGSAEPRVQKILAAAALGAPGGEQILALLGKSDEPEIINAVLRSARHLAAEGRRTPIDVSQAWRLALVPGVDRSALAEVIAEAPDAEPVLVTIANLEAGTGPGVGVGAMTACRALQTRKDGIAALNRLASGKSRPLAIYAERCLYDARRRGPVTCYEMFAPLAREC